MNSVGLQVFGYNRSFKDKTEKYLIKKLPSRLIGW